MKTLDEIIDEATAACRYTIADDLKALRDSGVFVERGTRAWAVAMHDDGKALFHYAWHNLAAPTPVKNDFSRLVELLRQLRTGWELAPPAEREVTPWEACKAWYEGKEVKNRSQQWSTLTNGISPPDFSISQWKYYIREPEGGK